MVCSTSSWYCLLLFCFKINWTPGIPREYIFLVEYFLHFFYLKIKVLTLSHGKKYTEKYNRYFVDTVCISWSLNSEQMLPVSVLGVIYEHFVTSKPPFRVIAYLHTNILYRYKIVIFNTNICWCKQLSTSFNLARAFLVDSWESHLGSRFGFEFFPFIKNWNCMTI